MLLPKSCQTSTAYCIYAELFRLGAFVGMWRVPPKKSPKNGGQENVETFLFKLGSLLFRACKHGETSRQVASNIYRNIVFLPLLDLVNSLVFHLYHFIVSSWSKLILLFIPASAEVSHFKRKRVLVLLPHGRENICKPSRFLCLELSSVGHIHWQSPLKITCIANFPGKQDIKHGYHRWYLHISSIYTYLIYTQIEYIHVKKYTLICFKYLKYGVYTNIYYIYYLWYTYHISDIYI